MPSPNDNGGAQQSDFVADGKERLAEAIRSAVLSRIQAAVMAEYSDRLGAAGFLWRIWLRWRMKAEIERRIAAETADNMASDEALY